MLADAPLRCLGAMLLAFLIDYALSAAATLVLMLVEDTVQNPNNEQILELAQAACDKVDAGTRIVR